MVEIVCVQILLFSVCTTALSLCEPHVCVLTKMSFAECVNNECFAIGLPSDVVAAASSVGSMQGESLSELTWLTSGTWRIDNLMPNLSSHLDLGVRTRRGSTKIRVLAALDGRQCQWLSRRDV